MRQDQVQNRKRYPYFNIENLLIDEYAPRIGASAFLVYCTFNRIAGQKDSCYPGMGYLEKKTGLSKNTILKSIAILKEERLIDVIPQIDEDGRSNTNIYVLLDLPSNFEHQGSQSAPSPVQKMNPPRSNSDSNRVQNLHPKKTESKQTDLRKQKEETASFCVNGEENKNPLQAMYQGLAPAKMKFGR